MRGEEVMDTVRDLISDQGYQSYTELRLAFKRACQLTKSSWLKDRDEQRLQFRANETDYTLDMSDIRSITHLFVYGIDTNKIYWHPLIRLDEVTFEDRVRETRNADGTSDHDRPRYYTRSGTATTARIIVTPTPDQDYNGRVDFIRHIEDIKRDTEVPIPAANHDDLAKLTSGYILRAKETEQEIILGRTYIREAEASLQTMVSDTEDRGTHNIKIKPWHWMR